MRCCVFNAATATEIYTLSLHDALPIYRARNAQGGLVEGVLDCADRTIAIHQIESQQCIPIRIENPFNRSEEHTSELQSRPHLVCRLLLEKKKTALTLSIYKLVILASSA